MIKNRRLNLNLGRVICGLLHTDGCLDSVMFTTSVLEGCPQESSLVDLSLVTKKVDMGGMIRTS